MLDQPLIINFAPTGAVADHNKNANVPIQQETIVADVVTAAQLGAGIAHLHIRQPNGAPSDDVDQFAALLAALRQHRDCAGLILCASTSGRHGQNAERRAAVLDLPPAIRPDMASLTLGSLNFPGGASVNDPATIRFLAARMLAQQVKPELEIFDIGMIEFAKTLIREGLLQPPYYFNLILGNVGGLQPSLPQLGFAVSQLPEQSIVALGGIGRHQRQANLLGLVAADGVRIGLEDNLWDQSDGKRSPATNPGLVGQFVSRATAMGRSIMTRQDIRTILALP